MYKEIVEIFRIGKNDEHASKLGSKHVLMKYDNQSTENMVLYNRLKDSEIFSKALICPRKTVRIARNRLQTN